MTPKQRFLACLRLEEPDRLPVMYQHLGGADHLQDATGLTLRQGYSDPEAYAKISMASHRLFGFDNVMAGWGDLLVEASAFGAKLRFTNDRQYPREDPLPMEKIDEVGEVDPLQHAQWSIPIKAAKIMSDRIGREVLVLGCASSPFIVAGSVIGYENLLVAQMTDADLAHRLLRKIVASERLLMQELVEFAGLEAIFISDALADAEQNTLALSQEFDIAYTREVVEAAKSSGLEVIVHNCSESPFAEEELEAYQPSAIHLAAGWKGLMGVVERIRNRQGLVLGVDHRELIYRARPEKIKVDTRKTVGEIAGIPGLMIAPACELSFDTPIENILAFKDAVHSLTVRSGK
jgi:uroporphyrinogen-III decarboxylase